MTTTTDEDARVREWVPLAWRVVRAMPLPRHVDPEDLMTDALVGVLEALRSYRPERGRKLVGWVAMTVRRRVVDGVRADTRCRQGRKRRPWRHPLSLTAATGAALVAPTSASASERAVDDADEWEGLLSPLPSRLRTVCRLVWRDGHTLRATARIVGLSESRVCQLVSEARRQLAASRQKRQEGRP